MMRFPDDIQNEVGLLMQTEAFGIVRYRESRDSQFTSIVDRARLDLLPLLKEAAGMRDIKLLLAIERDFMRVELEHIAYDEQNIKSLRKGIWQADAAAIMLDQVQAPEVYQHAAFYYTLSNDLLDKSDLPKDAAHKFFGSHRTRLLNWRNNQNDQEKTDLLITRTRYIDWARSEYKELQRLAMAAGDAHVRLPAEVREPFKQYRVRREYQLVA